MEPLSLYYTLGLGVGMLVLYVLFRSHLTEKRSYDLHRRFAEIFCALGLCMALAVLLAYGKAWAASGHIGGVLYLSYRNFATSVLLTALPMPFYLSLRHRGHLATAAVLALALALTGSRSALLFGGILLTLCCVYLMRSGVISRRCLVLLAAAAVSAVLCVVHREFPADVLIIMTVVTVNAVLGVVQESKAEKAIAALQEMTPATSRVLRGGAECTVPSRTLVPGDVVLLSAGDRIPADCRGLSLIHI